MCRRVLGLVFVGVLVLAVVVGCDEPRRDVVVARRSIPEGFVLDTSMVAVQSIPARDVEPHALERAGDVSGRVTRLTIFGGQQIVASAVAERNDLSSLLIPRGFRALSLPVDPRRVRGIRSGDSVDITVVDTHDGQPSARPLLQDVAVFAISDSSLTLILQPNEIQRLILADATGALRFSLRPVLEGDQRVPLETIHLDSIYGPKARATVRRFDRLGD